MGRESTKRGVSFDEVRVLALALPDVEETTSYGTPSFKVAKKMLARFHQDGESLVVPVDFLARDSLMQLEPDTFFITDHYLSYPLMLVRLAKARRGQVKALLKEAHASALFEAKQKRRRK